MGSEWNLYSEPTTARGNPRALRMSSEGTAQNEGLLGSVTSGGECKEVDG